MSTSARSDSQVEQQTEPKSGSATSGGATEGKAGKAARTRSGPAVYLARGVLMLAGLGFVVGFFMPWLRLGTVASLSGFALMVADGDVVASVSGPHRFLLFAVPLFGAALCASAIHGHRLAAWLALIAGGGVIVAGAITLILLFLDTTGAGMWIVTISAVIALVVGALSIARR